MDQDQAYNCLTWHIQNAKLYAISHLIYLIGYGLSLALALSLSL
jgi:hypothetical protein